MWRDGGTLETIILTPHAHTFTSLRVTPHWLTVGADRRLGRRPRGSIEPRRRPLSENSSTAKCGALLMLMLTLSSREASRLGKSEVRLQLWAEPEEENAVTFISQKASSHDTSLSVR